MGLKSDQIVNGGVVDSLKSRKNNLMAADSSPAANILDIDLLVLMYRIFETILKIWKKTQKST